MTTMRQRAAEGLQVGDRFTISRSFTADDIALFAQLSRDHNPVHGDDGYIALKGFKAPIAHGLLTASLMTEIGGQIGWLAASMSLRFKRPVYAGEMLHCEWLIAEIDERLNCLVVKLNKIFKGEHLLDNRIGKRGVVFANLADRLHIHATR
ncbi:MAG: MaoC family dehydratase [Betaproteobacteria bacterium]|nr:MaoC family dehydratase [Betaproteobacteria bacterium]